MAVIDIVISPSSTLLEGMFGDIRPDDLKEWFAGSGANDFRSQAELTLRQCPYNRIAVVDGVPAVCWGSWKGTLWMFATNRAVRYAKSLHKALLPEVSSLGQQFGRLEAYPGSWNKVHIRWLEWLGFKRTSKIVTGPLNHTFYHYIKE